jgi:hypothetical protein
LTQPLDHHPAQLRAALEPSRLRPASSQPRFLVGEVDAVAAAAAAAVDLARDRRVRAAEITAALAV